MSNQIHVAVPGSPAVLQFDETVRIGRADTNGIVVDDEYVSTEHIELRRVGDGWEILDVGSTNGTFVRGERISRAPLGHLTRVRLGHPQGVELLIKIPSLAPGPATMFIDGEAIVDRYLSEEAPNEMSERTRVLRATLKKRHQEETHTWLKRTRRLQVVAGILLLISFAVGGYAVLEGRRSRALRSAAAELFHTLKGLELDLARLEAVAGPDPSAQERRERLEAQYDDLLATLGIYSEDTPEEVQLIYRTVHRLGESEVTVPQEFVDEVLRYIEQWNERDLEA
ncbi:MAG: FHA domain-containing protein, partial [Gemmatimonadetes bacterium]|nr:FHA domain-containing protein [Gemmatimonadota bacterium]